MNSNKEKNKICERFVPPNKRTKCDKEIYLNDKDNNKDENLGKCK